VIKHPQSDGEFESTINKVRSTRSPTLIMVDKLIPSPPKKTRTNQKHESENKRTWSGATRCRRHTLRRTLYHRSPMGAGRQMQRCIKLNCTTLRALQIVLNQALNLTYISARMTTNSSCANYLPTARIEFGINQNCKIYKPQSHFTLKSDEFQYQNGLRKSSRLL
jgi:hypothetical protein